MRFNKNKKKWKVGFAFLPIEIGDTIVWLERYIYQDYGGIATVVDFYEGCGARVGYPCDCFRHKFKD